MKKQSAFYKFIRFIVRNAVHRFDEEGTGNIPEEACIFVGNHSQMYGPILSELYAPGAPDMRYTWCAGEMMDKRAVADYAYRDFWCDKPVYIKWFYRLLSYIIVPLAVSIFNNAYTIAVYRDMRIGQTFKDTIRALDEGANIVIFPEGRSKHNNIIYDFQKHFVDVAKVYYGRTKKEVQFVPVYIAPKLKKVYYGKPVRFDHTVPMDEERERICATLMDTITTLACEAPEHTVVPYENLQKKFYKKNRPLETYDA